jgi:hypothetical protein
MCGKEGTTLQNQNKRFYHSTHIYTDYILSHHNVGQPLLPSELHGLQQMDMVITIFEMGTIIFDRSNRLVWIFSFQFMSVI